MKLIVGLGNPGNKYAQTRHNVGWMVIDQLATRLEVESWRFGSKFEAETAESSHNDEKIILAKPQTFMNESGRAVQKLMQFYKLSPSDVIVIYDEIDLPLGQVRLRQEGSGGGHRGVESVINHIGEHFTRVRVGIDPNDRTKEPSEIYVLKPFSVEQREQLPTVIHNTIGAILSQLSTEPETPSAI